VVPSDDYQGRAGADFMKKKLGVTRVYVLDDKGLYGKGVADAFRFSAGDIGLKVVGHKGWDADPKDTDPKYAKLIAMIRKSRADGIYLGGSVSSNGGQLIRELLSKIDKVKLLVPDGFLSSAIFEGGPVDGVFGTFPAARATASGDLLKSTLVKTDPNTQIDPYFVYAAAAAEVLLDAICRSNGSREDVIAKLFKTKLKTKLKTVVGRMRFDKNGDPVNVAPTRYRVYVAREGAWNSFDSVRVGRWHTVHSRRACLKPATVPK
jgi:branched-chain amino acid transport system substrate-binding protein